MKKIMAALLVLLVSGVVALAAQVPADGVYYALGDNFDNGWKDAVTVVVKGGKISSVSWDGINNLGLPGKKEYSNAGKYGMEKAAKQGAWHKQAAAVEAYVVKNQGVKDIKVNDKDATDAITGATLKVKGFIAAYQKAVASKVVAKGSYKKDGIFFAEDADFAKSGWKDNALVVIANGTIVDLVWSGVSKTKGAKSKYETSLEGKYGMEKQAKLGAWHLQADKVTAQFIKDQDAKVDAVTGASIDISGFKTLVLSALKAAR